MLPSPAPTGAASASRPQLSPSQFQRFAALIYDLSGMRFEESKNYFIAAKIETRMQALGLPTIEAYQTYLDSPSGRTEYGYLIDEISINETFFYRHEPQLQAFRETVLQPLIFARRNQRQLRLRIWSCAASTGDELYTLALMLHDMGAVGKDITFELVGTDISHDALEKARAATYRRYNIRNVPPAQLQQFFTTGGTPPAETWTLKPEIKNMCRFQESNLIDPVRCSALGKFDIIFCRNVLIYFDDPSKDRVVTNLANNLVEDGVLLLGHSENIYSQRHLLVQDRGRAAAIAYTKAPPGTPRY